MTNAQKKEALDKLWKQRQQPGGQQQQKGSAPPCQASHGQQHKASVTRIHEEPADASSQSAESQFSKELVFATLVANSVEHWEPMSLRSPDDAEEDSDEEKDSHDDSSPVPLLVPPLSDNDNADDEASVFELHPRWLPQTASNPCCHKRQCSMA